MWFNENSRGPLVEIYLQQIEESGGVLSYDDEQVKTLTHLQNLYDQLIDKQNRPRSGTRGIFFWRKQKQASKLSGLYIYGGVGRGKSMLMDLFFDAVPIRRKQRIHYHHFMRMVHAKINKGLVRGSSDGGDDGLVNLANELSKTTELLCFDDFHVTDIGDAMILGPLFKAMLKGGMSIVITSNRIPDDLYKGGINRARFLPFIDCVKSELEICDLHGDTDYRSHFISQSQIYNVPLSNATDKKLQTIFKHLSHGSVAQETKISVNGRVIVFDQTARGVAMVTFDTLCRAPLGASDYIALQEEFHTLILSNIPQMGSDEHNEAKRFVTLIDVLYDHRVNLICSAAVDSEYLYTEGIGAFEFRRTASRLKEMQSTDYISRSHRQ